MLVLSRKRGEVIHIGDGITVTVIDIDRNKVRLGIFAPRSVPIYRQELLPITPKEPPNGDTHPQTPQTTDGTAGIRASEVPGG